MIVACVDLPALPLQLAWRREPALRAQAVVVVDEDRPQGSILWACERARGAGVLPGMRYAHALGLCGNLRARVVADELVAEAITELRTALAKLSPRVEPSDDPGTFWLDGDGLQRIFGVAAGASWAGSIAHVIDALGYRGALVVGFSRFATFAIARGMEVREASRNGLRIVAFDRDADERRAASAVPLARLDLAPKLRDALARLGVTTVGQMVRLPAGGILERFGRDAFRLYQLAAGERWDPIVPVAPPETPDERVLLDDEDDDVERLAFVLKGATDRLLARLAARGCACAALHVELTMRPSSCASNDAPGLGPRASGLEASRPPNRPLFSGGPRPEVRGPERKPSCLGLAATELRADCIKPAAPTLDGRGLARLVHLRLTGSPPAAPVVALRVWADEIAATRDQLALFAHKPRRDLGAGDEALARLRAELGDDAVVRAVLREGHLPEASFGWERLVNLVAASPRPRLVRPLVRRLLSRPQPLPQQARQVRDDGWLLSGLEHGAVSRIVGPYVVSGGWWTHEQHREYHFAELKRGDCLWVYFDRARRRWFWQGGVE